MGEVKSLEQLALVAAFLCPGLIALFVRAQFLTGRTDMSRDAILAFFTLSTVYYGLLAPFLPWLSRHGASPGDGPVALFAWTVIGPVILGSLLGLNASRGWLWRALLFCRIRTVHVIPTAWDQTFGTLRASWLIVTLKDGSRVAGFFGALSFASSDPRERDLFIQTAYRIDTEGVWHEVAGCGILVPGGEIRCVEVFPDKRS